MCLALTMSILFFGIAVVLPLSVSLLSSIPICFLICWVGYIVQDRIDLLIYKRSCEEADRSLKIWGMSEEELRHLCQENMLDSIDTEIVVCRLVHHMSGRELYEKIGYSKAQMIRREKRIEARLKIKLKDR